jgi:hypothetical protein
MRLLIAIAAVLVAGSVAHADGTAPTAVQSAAAPPPAKTVTLYCRAVFHEGMLLRGGNCRTREEWDRLRRAGEHDLSDFENRSYSR